MTNAALPLIIAMLAKGTQELMFDQSVELSQTEIDQVRSWLDRVSSAEKNGHPLPDPPLFMSHLVPSDD